jgi:hypothetical protein
MEYRFKSYTGEIFTNKQVDTYNQLTKTIESRQAQGLPCEALLNGRHNFFECCSQKQSNRKIKQ